MTAATFPMSKLDDFAKMEALRARLMPHQLTEADADPPAPAWIGHIDPEGYTVLGGRRSSGKSTLAAWWISRLYHTQGLRSAVLDYEHLRRKWARDLKAFGVPYEDVVYIPAQTPLAEGLTVLQETFKERQVAFVVVDSAMLAHAGAKKQIDDPADGAMQLKRALSALSVPSLLLTHLNAQGQAYGSQYFENLADVVYELTKEGDGTSTLKANKARNYPQTLDGKRWTLTYVKSGDQVVEIRERGCLSSVAAAIADFLEGKGWQPISEIVKATGKSDKTLRTALQGWNRIESREADPRSHLKEYRLLPEEGKVVTSPGPS